jgi:hypothetical protein
VVQEGASGCLNPDLLAGADHCETVEGLHGRGCLTLGGPEGAEVVVTDESLRLIPPSQRLATAPLQKDEVDAG